ncbi:copper resistance protein NlpE N-terminal domain-containing protein [Acinetobacter sp. ANC 3903]|nr:copper resistance protein NlpE N-terminal domain-containing protein [Acinetobacter sp. ANC 3903]
MSDTVETSLDWPGEYKGFFPCADCQGIETELKLKADILSSVKII